MPSIVDVAKRARVSVSTVSRVINKSAHPVSEAARERVLAAAEELDYAPSALARALVNAETRILGIIVGDSSDPYFATIVRSLSDAARAEGYLTIILNSDRIPEIELNFVRLLRDYRADGIIFAGGGLTDPDYVQQVNHLLGWFRSRGVPVVALGAHLFDVPQVNIDNYQAARDATEYLIGLGHRRIGIIGGPEVLTTSAMRTEGYRSALAAHGLPFDPALVAGSDFTYEGGQAAAAQLLGVSPQPTAIFATNDMVAIGCVTHLRGRGLSVPGDMSVVGFDDIAAAQFVEPPLTTVQVPMRELGVAGLGQLLKLKNGVEAVEPLLRLPHRLVVRASAGPPREMQAELSKEGVA